MIAKVRGCLDFEVFSQESYRRVRAAAIAFVFLGLAARLVRYLLCFPLWPDETFLAANFLDGSYSGLVGPLAYHQVAPLFFLFAEQLAVNLFSFSEYALRFFPFLAGMASVLIFFRLAGQLLQGSARLAAVAIFAVSYYPIRHSAEVKPYSIDLLVSLLLLKLAVDWWTDPGRTRRLWLLTAFIPLAVGFSFPAVFVGGGIGIGILLAVRRGKDIRAVRAAAAYILVLLIAFGAVYAVSTGPQYETEKWLSGPHPETAGFNVDRAWVKAFPPWRNPEKLPLWLLKIHTGMLFAYPNGGRDGGSALTLILFVVGTVVLARRKGGDLAVFFIAPFLLALAAAALHRYPYGYNTRFNLYLAPLICLPAGLGAARMVSLIRPPKIRAGVMVVFLGALGIFGAGNIILDMARPYKNREDVASRRFARKFWAEESRDAELACVYTDLGLDFFPRLWNWGHSSRYLCNQAIYSPLHQDGPHQPRWEMVSPDRPLKFVVFSVPARFEPYAELDREAWESWRAEIETRYRLSGYRKHQVNEEVPSHHEVYEVYEFVPR